MLKKILISLFVLTLCTSVYAIEKIKIVTTIPDFKNFAEIIGGDKVTVISFIKGYQDAHHFEIKPSDIMKLHGTDILIINGADLDYWIYPLIENSRNENIKKGNKGFIDASEGIQMLDAPLTKIDRSMGDVHPYGNPHYNLSPSAMKTAFIHIAEVMSSLYPEYSVYFKQNAENYEKKLDVKINTWENTLKDTHSLGIIVYHNSWAYFLKEFHLHPIGYIEPKPGLSPPPTYLNSLIQNINSKKRNGIILKEIYANYDIANYVAERTGYEVKTVATYVGGTKDARDYISMIDYLVQTIAKGCPKRFQNL